jgi:hypothetical protein
VKIARNFETQGTVLLFRHFDGFTVKRKLLFQRTILFTLIIQGTEYAEMTLFFRLPGYQPAFENYSSLAGRYRQTKTISPIGRSVYHIKIMTYLSLHSSLAEQRAFCPSSPDGQKK